MIGRRDVPLGAKAMATDRYVGSVQAVLVGPTHGVAYLHVRTRGRRAEDRFVSGELIRAVVGRTVWLRHPGRDVEAAALRSRPPGFEPDHPDARPPEGEIGLAAR